MKSWIMNSGELLGVSEKQAEKFSKEWYNIKRQETSALWEQRQDIHKGDEISMSKLGEQVAEAVQAKRARKGKARTKYLQMSRKQLENFLEQEKRIKLGASITRFAIDAEASDEERAVLEREMAIEKLIGITEKELRGASSRRYKGSKRG
jgi:hypothetical protein